MAAAIAKGEDRISSLPDCLIIEILSRLDNTKYAVRTGTLSKRWQHLWPQLSNLSFTHIDSRNIPEFYLSLKRILLSQTTQLKKLKLHAYYTDQMTPISECIRIAIRRNVREVDFDMDYQAGNRFDGFVLPDFFFTCSSFIRARLCNCLFERAGVISWENLRSLHIERAEIEEDMLENILSGSPVLETLELDGCYGFDRIDITTNKSVKNLGLYGGLGCMIQINAPYILSLAIKGEVMSDYFMLLNVSSLVSVELNIWKERFLRPTDMQEILEEQESNEEMLEGCLLELAHAHSKEVKLGKLCLETLARLKAKGYIIPSNLKVLGEIASSYIGDSK